MDYRELIRSRIVTVDDATTKLFSYCKNAFSDIKKRELRRYFTEGRVSVNDKVITTAYCLQLKEGDVVTIHEESEIVKSKREIAVRLEEYRKRIIFENDVFAVASKASGEQAIAHSEFSDTLTQLLWSGEGVEDGAKSDLGGCPQLYYLGKARGGLTLISRNRECLQLLRSMLLSKELHMKYTCLICGYIGDVGSEVILPPDDICFQTLKLLVLEITPSRSARYISLVEITILFEEYPNKYTPEEERRILRTPSTKEDCDFLNFPSRAVKNIRYRLLARDTPIVGENGLVKKTKGFYSFLSGLEFSGTSNFKGLRFGLPLPDKFEKVLKVERQMWEFWLSKKNAVIREFQERDGRLTEGGDDTNRPVEYITGEAIFCGLKFSVNNSVMIPRKSSEILVDAAVEYSEYLVQKLGEGTVIRILDIGTGSGCLLLSAMSILRAKGILCRGVGIDISELALGVAESNATRLGLNNYARFHNCDFSDLTKLRFESYSEIDSEQLSCLDIHIILCNPPYSCRTDTARLSASCIDHEPGLALFTQGRSTDNYRVISHSIKQLIFQRDFSVTCSRVILEIGHGQYDEVMQIFAEQIVCLADGKSESLFSLEKKYLDYNNILRCLVYSVRY